MNDICATPTAILTKWQIVKSSFSGNSQNVRSKKLFAHFQNINVIPGYSTSNLNFDNSILFYLANVLFYSILYSILSRWTILPYFLFCILFYYVISILSCSLLYFILFYMVPYKCCCFSARSTQGLIQINSSPGVPFFNKRLLQTKR